MILAVGAAGCGSSVTTAPGSTATTVAPPPTVPVATTVAAGPAAAAGTTAAPATTAAPPLPDQLSGFDRATVLIDGEPWLVAVAATPDQRAQGLMFVTDLGDLDGMLFVFPAATTNGFWMKDTVLALEIAFFSADGSLVDVLAMDPCVADPCPLYSPRGEYRFAVEAVPGRLGALGPDARLAVPD